MVGDGHQNWICDSTVSSLDQHPTNRADDVPNHSTCSDPRNTTSPQGDAPHWIGSRVSSTRTDGRHHTHSQTLDTRILAFSQASTLATNVDFFSKPWSAASLGCLKIDHALLGYTYKTRTLRLDIHVHESGVRCYQQSKKSKKQKQSTFSKTQE